MIDKYYYFSGKRGSLSAPKTLTRLSKFSDADVGDFAKNDPTLAKFFPIVRRKAHSMRNAQAMFPTDRLHVDLAHMKNEFGQPYLYALICRDIYSHKVFSIPTRSKNAEHMTEAFKVLLNELRPIRKRFPRLMRQSVFMSDRGLDFNSARLTALLESEGHRLVYLNPPYKAFAAELAIKLYRQKLSLIRARLGDALYKKHRGWLRYNRIVLNSLNNSPSRTLANCTADQIYNMQFKAIKALQSVQPKFTLESWKKFNAKQLVEGQAYLNKFCRLVIRFTNFFTKISMKQRISDMVYKIIRIRPATISDPRKHILLKLEDMNQNEVRGWKRIDDVVLIPTDSKMNPGTKGWRPTISKIVKTKTKRGQIRYRVNFMGTLSKISRIMMM